MISLRKLYFVERSLPGSDDWEPVSVTMRDKSDAQRHADRLTAAYPAYRYRVTEFRRA